MELRGQNIGVIGLGPKTGVSLVRYLHAQGAQSVIFDEGGASKIEKNLEALRGCAMTVEASPESSALKNCKTWVVSPGVPCYKPYLVQARKDGVHTVSEIEFAAERVDAPILAVTGTNGKSTTTELLGHILRGSKASVFVGGNLGRPLVEAVGGTWDWIVVELSSFQMELTDHFSPRAACVLNVSPNHLDRHGNMATYASLKEKLASMVRKDGKAILNADDEFCQDMRAKIPCDVWTFSSREDARSDFSVQCDRMKTPFGELSLEGFSLLGRHNLENAMAAVAMAYSVGISRSDIENGLRTFEGLPHRLQNLGSVRDVRFINDSKSTTPASSVRALQAIEQPVILLAGGKPKGFSYAEMAEAAVKKVKKIILFGEAAKTMEREFSSTSIEVTATLQDAFSLATKVARKGDTVLLSPANASYDQFANYEERGRCFMDLVANWKETT